MAEEFQRREVAPLDSTIEMVKKLLKEWNLDPDQVKDKERNMWYLAQGSAKFHIEIFSFNKGPQIGNVDCLEVGGIIMKLPQENFLPLYRRLLELNSTSVGVYFAIRQNLVMLLATRELEGIDYMELKTMVDDVRFFSDYWDDILIEEFKGSK